ncbi:outer membrane protein assembly factor BamB family protein [Halosimplex halophilum]|uniref:outer membrane protein assembly factor BamB family protein n=1 Tax=Halosimplex halophilum TaxID=2559572 RepID=UPI00107F7AEB|nr:PQQ-binding-like beta-propeller repeat protein [Halosimplex halophilum]
MTSRRRFLRDAGVTAALGLGGALAGCGYRPGGGDIRWREDFRTGFYGDDPVGVAGGVLYGVTPSSRTYDFEAEEWVTRSSVTGYDTADGSRRLNREFDPDITASALGDGTLAVAFADGSVASLAAEGVQWRGPVDGQVRAVAGAPGRVYAVTADGRLVATAGGSREWTVDLPGADGETDSDGDRRPATFVAASEDHVLAATGNGAAGFAPDGRRLWRRRDLEPPEGAAFVDGRVHVWWSLDLVALDPSTGDPRWTLPGLVESVAIAGSGGYRVGHGELVAFDADGERRWTRDSDTRYEDRYGGGVAADADGVYATRDGDLVAHDPADGSVRWVVEAEVEHGPYLVDGGVLVAVDGELVCHHRASTA